MRTSTVSDLTERWAEIWSNTIADAERRTGVNIEDWRVAGRRTKALPDGETADFWQAEGLRQVEEYLKWFDKSGWSIATMPDGKPGIEWEAEVVFGESHVRLIVDAIYALNHAPWTDVTPDQLVVTDYKTGSRSPHTGPIQLGLYASAIEKVYGMRPKWGAIYMCRDGRLNDLIDLTPWSIDFFEYQFGAMQAYMDTGYFPPTVSDHCGYCSYADYCAAVGGSKSAGYPLQIHTKEKK